MDREDGTIIRRAWAKVNLTLEVLGRRRDGYHEIVSVMQAISLCDVLAFKPHDGIQLTCDIAELASPNNLIYKAARLMQKLAHEECGVAICLNKSIPVAGGLGGGSSDAAATLRVLNKMWGINLSARELSRLAAQLGSDVPFFTGGSPTALARGRGDVVKGLRSPVRTRLVLLRPPVDITNKTGEMYARLTARHFTDGQYTRRMTDCIEQRGSITNHLCYNVFDDISLSFFPGLYRYRERFLSAGAREVHLTGAGPTLFTIVDEQADAQMIYGRLKKEGMEVYMAETI